MEQLTFDNERLDLAKVQGVIWIKKNLTHLNQHNTVQGAKKDFSLKLFQLWNTFFNKSEDTL